MPVVSIIMPVYNGEKFVKYAIDSVINQSYKDFEFIIINDASTDSTNQILEQFQRDDSRIKVLTNQQNLGVVKSLNVGINNALGSLIARIDADDAWYPNKLELQVEKFEQDPDLMLLGTQKRLIDTNGDEIIQKKLYHYYSYSEVRKTIHKANIFTHSSVVYRKKLVDKVGPYNERYKNTEDYEFWLRICSQNKAMILPQILVDYRVHGNSISSRTKLQQFYYSIKARVDYIPQYGFSAFFSEIFIKKVIFLILPSFVVKFYEKRQTAAK